LPFLGATNSLSVPPPLMAPSRLCTGRRGSPACSAHRACPLIGGATKAAGPRQARGQDGGAVHRRAKGGGRADHPRGSRGSFPARTRLSASPLRAAASAAQGEGSALGDIENGTAAPRPTPRTALSPAHVPRPAPAAVQLTRVRRRRSRVSAAKVGRRLGRAQAAPPGVLRQAGRGASPRAAPPPTAAAPSRKPTAPRSGGGRS